jgi:hypothetical protein
MRRRHVVVGGVAAVLLLAGAQLVALVSSLGSPEEAGPGEDVDDVAMGLAVGDEQGARSVVAYGGHGAWVDAYDYDPALAERGRSPAIGADDIGAMADHGVRTLYLQGAMDRGQPEVGPTSPELLGELLRRAHDEGLRVVAWYLPRLGDLDRDVAFVRALDEFADEGHRFDGLAIDIEWREAVPDHEDRSARVVELSQRLRTLVGADALGAIVPSPVHLEVVNTGFWPGFPWEELAPLYDAWMTMGYWTERRPESGLRQGYGYTADNVARLRRLLGDEDAVVHPIGGIGTAVTTEDLDGYVDALAATDAAGGSVYDWATLAEPARAQLGEALGDALEGDEGTAGDPGD